jgi:hypothetical protein
MKKVKKITKKKQRSMERTTKRKKLAEWSKQVRSRDKTCIICERNDHLNAHHILAKETYKDLMFETQNGVTLCPRHHKFGKYSAHKNPIWFAKILQESHPDQYMWAVEHIGLTE